MSLRSILQGPLPAAIDPADRRFVEGSEEDRRRAREQWHRSRFEAEVMRSGLTEIPRANLRPVMRAMLEDDRDGTFYLPRRDQLVDITFTNAVAFFAAADGSLVLLERPAGMVKNRLELEQRQAEREARRNAPVRRRQRR